MVQQLGWHLIRNRLPGLDEHLVCDTLRLRGKVDRFELHSGRIDRFSLRPGISLLWRALGMLGRVSPHNS